MGRAGGRGLRSESSIPAASMTDAEAQSAPPSAPVEDKPQTERKVIGGFYKVASVVLKEAVV